MSSSGIDPVNSGPIVLRAYNNASDRHTVILQTYDNPVSSNRLLTTTTGGCLRPTDAPSVSSLVVGSTLMGNQATFSTLTTSTLVASSIQTSTLSSGDVNCLSLTCSGPALFRGSVSNITLGSNVTLLSPYWGKYIFVSSNENIQLTLMGASDGVFMTIQNIALNSTTTVTNVFGGTRSIGYRSTMTVMYNGGKSQWYSLTNN